jgi:hypothetical protein
MELLLKMYQEWLQIAHESRSRPHVGVQILSRVLVL